ncbi:hypothetical protein ASPWEDRAFT_168651 [Aspergillus wentii DTO 134E9]|uniref:Uncharacterized protein n=1 Tax=Aspergillus wentii DTO 134E9 TaxID=1073089 RepID=A0A1L9RV24_ASPWE|nr:uncharacterized protein ASPWEDRAFT_168651 [Aspergillus wentii DTO 134E9]KAI9928678.1 hypothetical protein MW887_001894 [Aspergillus wentii]OJJ38765.1 hypothetical protein ASPWEDRAFT_168651 [Aspergillus wentii DTO 134E9]
MNENVRRTDGHEATWSINTHHNASYIQLDFRPSGGSAVLLFQGRGHQNLAAVIGFHNYSVWCDLTTDANFEATAIWNDPWHPDLQDGRDIRWQNLDRKRLGGNAIAINPSQIEGKRVYYVQLTIDPEFHVPGTRTPNLHSWVA